MSNQAQQAEVRIEEATSVISHDNTFGPVAIINQELVTPKTIAILDEAMKLGKANKVGHGIYSIVFRLDGQPWGELLENGTHKMNNWRYYWGPKAAVCNLKHCVQVAIDTSKKEIYMEDGNEFVCMSVYMLVWKNILQGFLHECGHAQSFEMNGADLLEAIDANDEEALQAEEDSADKYAREMLFKLAQEFDIEPEFSYEVATHINVWLDEELLAIETDPKPDEDMLQWAKAQRMFIERGGVFYSPGNPSEGESDLYMKTFKEFLHMCSGADEKDPKWNMEPKGPVLELRQEPWTAKAGDAGTNTTVENNNYDDSGSDYDPEYDGDFEYPAGFQGVGQFQQAHAQQPQQQWQQPSQQDGYQQVQQYQQPVAQPDYSSYGYPVQNQAPAQQPQQQQWQQPAQQQAPVQPTMNDQAAAVGGMAYQPLNIATEDVKRIVYGLFKKLNAHIFAGCQFNPANPSTPFEAASNIMAPLPLTKEEMMFVKEMTITEGESKRGGVKCNGTIQGTFMDKASMLPGYEFVIQSPEGHQLVRKLIPQNPNKPGKDGNGLSPTAADARRGNNILWLLDVMSNKFIGRIYNGQVQKNEAGKWVSAE